MIELKPCPFCGGEARLLLNAKRKIYGKDEYRTGVVACCNVCEARMFYGSEKLAIEAWNRREEPEPPKMGKWVIRVIWPPDGEDCYCSECGKGECLPNWKYCPNCGAKMEVDYGTVD